MKNIVLMVVAVLIAVVGLVSAASAQCTGGLGDVLAANKYEYNIGETIEFRVELETSGSNPCTLYIPSVTFFGPPSGGGLHPCTNPGGTFWLTPAGNNIIEPGEMVIYTSTHWPALSVPVQKNWALGDGIRYADICTEFCWGSGFATCRRDETGTEIRVLCPEPCLSITKDACGYSKVGDIVDYYITIENCGTPADNFDLEDIEVSDSLLGDLSGEFPDVLAPGESFAGGPFPYLVQPDDPNPLVNTAYVVAKDECDTNRVVGPYYAYEEVILLHPDIDVTKTCMTPVVPPGGAAQFDIVITNTGDVELDVTSTDPAAPPTQPERFAPLESRTYTVYADCGADPWVYNEITVYGDIPDEYCNLPNPPVQAAASDSCQCRICGLDCTKTVRPDVSKAGHDVIYELCAINTGQNCDLTLVSVYDDVIGDLTYLFDSTLPSGTPPECHTVTYTIPEGAPDYIVNTATFTYLEPDGVTERVCTASETVHVLHPGLRVGVECLTNPVPEGMPAEFGVTIENTGDVELEVVTNWGLYPGPFTVVPGVPWYQIAEAPCEGPEACFYIEILGELPDMYEFDNTYPDTADTCCPCPGENGCTPGFWKNHPVCWCDRFDPDDDLLGEVFDVPSQLDDYAEDTLMDGMNYGGGKGVEGAARNLFRSAVAAILNGCSSDVPYPMSADAVITAVNAALATLDRGEILAVHTMLDVLNNLGCSIDAHCRPIGDEPDDKRAEANTGEITNPADHRAGINPTVAWSQPIPNPFMGTTTINFGIPKSGSVAIDIYDVAGRHVSTVLNAEKAAGTHEAVWNGRNSNGASVPAGVYFYRFTFDNEFLMKKMIVMR